MCVNGCGKPAVSAPKSRGGRPGLYCGPACRQAVYRAKRQPTPADLRYDALGLFRRLELPAFGDDVLERVDAAQLPDLVSFLRTATAGLNGVCSILAAAAGVAIPPQPGSVTGTAVTERQAAEIAECFWCDENGMIEDADGDLVPCPHDDPAESRNAAPAAPEPAAAKPSPGTSSWGSPEYWASAPEPAEPTPASSRSTPTPAPAKPAKRRTAIGGLTPTDEQHAIIEACASGADLVVEAGAGTGKTSTLKMAATAMRGRGLYIAFNKAIADEAAKSFPRSVDCRTAHSLAYRAVGKAYADAKGLNGPRVPSKRAAEILRILEPLRVNADVVLTPAKQARLAVEAVSNFCYSADLEIGSHHVTVPEGLNPTETGLLREAVLPYARKAWDDLRDPNSGSLRFEHDHYLKIWAMGDPRLDVDYVLLDEAQDSNPLIARLVQSQHEAQRIAVGDACQAIYGWRGAVDAMETWPGQTRLLLSQSWRFGPEIAAEANKWLGHLKSRLRLTGSGPAGTVTTTASKVDATLCRTNAAALSEAMYAMESGRKAALVGGGRHIKDLAEAAISLQEGKGTDHPELVMFNNWDELRVYATTEQAGSDLIALVRLIDNHGAEEVKKAAGALVAENRADIVISTVHKAKGREWNRVKIATDFPEPRVHPQTNRYLPLSRPDMMLAYVAVTRAKTLLDRRGLTGVDLIGTVANKDDDDRHARPW